jgi:hypothetical protein
MGGYVTRPSGFFRGRLFFGSLRSHGHAAFYKHVGATALELAALEASRPAEKSID